MCAHGRWTGVCGSYWNYQDAFVVCRLLGYPATGMKLKTLLAINILALRLGTQLG